MRVEFVCNSENETSGDKQKHFAVLLFACILPNLFGYLFGVRHILTHLLTTKRKNVASFVNIDCYLRSFKFQRWTDFTAPKKRTAQNTNILRKLSVMH